MSIDPVEYGKLLHAVEELEHKVSAMESDIKELLQLANQSKGGFWIGMTIAAAVGRVLTMLNKVFWH